jgi:predicted enzyme related to lactoylglutathione lyase
MPTVQHFEIAVDKIKRAQEFYKKILDRITKNT